MFSGRLVVGRAGAAVLLARVCHELRIRSIIDAVVKWDPQQCALSPGTRIVTLIINALASRQPLYKVKDFYRRRHLDLIFEEPVDLDSLGDSALGRALDKIAALENPQRLVESVALSAVNHGKMQIRSVHADTTSVSVYGTFEPTDGDVKFCEQVPEKKLIRITNGYSKQKHRN